MAIKLIIGPYRSLKYDIDFKIGRTRRFYLGYGEPISFISYKENWGYQLSNDFDNCTCLVEKSPIEVLETFREKINKYLC